MVSIFEFSQAIFPYYIIIKKLKTSDLKFLILKITLSLSSSYATIQHLFY